jgi:hypothetical protein
MMFKATTIVALVAALMPTAQAAATGSKLDIRQERACPVNGTACGWYLLNPGGTRHCTYQNRPFPTLAPLSEAHPTDPSCLCVTLGTTRDFLERLRPDNTIIVDDSIWEVVNSVPVSWVKQCKQSCTNQMLPWDPVTICNEDRD